MLAMPKLPRISSKKVIKALESLGFKKTRQTGSHVIMKKTTPDGQIGCVIPIHRELKVGTLSGILKQARVSPEEFIDSL
jgi:predicted RNA binding protein YcfA (HicA-like mRNA interferase family)